MTIGLEQLARRVEDVFTAVMGVRRELDRACERIRDVEHAMPPTDYSKVANDSNTTYHNLDEWVEGWFVVRFARGSEHGNGQDIAWCPRWYEHPEAELRLRALWRSWEAQRWDEKAALATWLRECADPQFAQLTVADGTFRFCKRDEHRKSPTPFPVLRRVSLLKRPKP